MKKVIGAFEIVGFPDFGVNEIIAKIDTGAASGAIHATRIKVVKLPTNQDAISFYPLGTGKKIVSSAFTLTNVRNSMGNSESRYVVPTTVIIEGVQYPINISLTNRANMKKKVLIGRKFLREHGFVVDTIKGTEYRNEIG